jgi:uncharacterized protein
MVAGKNGGSTLLKLVLDTHLVLEWQLWQSPRHQAFNTLAAQFLVSDATLDEWRRVLAYPLFALTGEQQIALLAQYQSKTTHLACSELGDLPKCRDPNDQKFLSLAYSAGADALLTRDKKLLKIGKHRRYREVFHTITPEAWWQSNLDQLHS